VYKIYIKMEQDERIEFEKLVEVGRIRIEQYKAAVMTEQWERNPLLSFRNDEYDPHYEMTTSEDYIKGVIDNDDVSIENIFTPNVTSNIIICVGDQELHLHKEVLCKHSPVFEEMLKDNKNSNIKLQEKDVDNVVLFFSYFYPDRKIPFKDKYDYYGLLKLCKKYKTKWLKEIIRNHLHLRVSIFQHRGEFVHDTKEAFNYFKYRYSQNTSDDCDFNNSIISYDDTLILYVWCLAERFHLNDIVSSCKKYIFELSLWYLKQEDIFKLLSEESQMHINKYCLKRAIASYDYNSDHDFYRDYRDRALEQCIDELTTIKPDCSCMQQPKRKRTEQCEDE